jgi:glycerophosphoryl diester phosphodiesterase
LLDLPVRIAHAYGNRRSRIERAIEAGVDFIEVDIRYERGHVWARHELRILNLPLLYNFGIKGIHREGPWATSLGRLFMRLDIAPIRFDDLIERTSGRVGLLLDFKSDRYSNATARRFVARVFADLAAQPYVGRLACCGNWRLLDIVCEQQPEADVWYSVDSESDWRAIEPRLVPAGAIGAITIQHDLLTPERARLLRERQIRVFAWDIDHEEQARRALALGARGIIADDLHMLMDLTETTHRAAS